MINTEGFRMLYIDETGELKEIDLKAAKKRRI